MDRYLCQLCFTMVYFGDKHPCFSNMDYETNYTVPHPGYPISWDSKGHAANSNEIYGNMCQSAHHNYSWQASTSHVNSVLFVGNNATAEVSLELDRDFTDLPVQTEASFHAPLRRRMDFGVIQPLHSKGDTETQPGPSTILPHSIGPDEKKQYVCHFRSKQFKQKSVIRHFVTQTGKRSIICDTCGKGFTQKGAYNKHARTHTGEKPFACKTCGKEFARKDSLNIHTRMHTGEKPYDCGTCGKHFAHKGTLDKHVRTHTGEKPFACDVCGKKFAQKDKLSRHARTHTEKKPYLCDICGRSFFDQSDHRRHVETHYGIKRFRCGECGETFSSNEHRNRHSREKHPHEFSHHMS